MKRASSARRMRPFGPLSCRVCEALFHPLDGGVCPRCHNVLCADHFGSLAGTAACTACNNGPEAGGRTAARLLQFRTRPRGSIR